jgi:hypothetical protein
MALTRPYKIGLKVQKVHPRWGGIRAWLNSPGKTLPGRSSAFSHNSTICPVATLRGYEQKTESFGSQEDEGRTRLFLAVVRPHKPVASSTVARWLESMLEKPGIDTGIFKAHSVRGAATSAAASSGQTTADILKAADWSSESVFTKFYYKPVHSGHFRRGSVLQGWTLATNYHSGYVRPSHSGLYEEGEVNISTSHPLLP